MRRLKLTQRASKLFGQPAPTTPSEQQRWHSAVQSSSIALFIQHGGSLPDRDAVAALQSSTSQLLHPIPPAEREAAARGLILEHLGISSGTRDVATLACLHVLPPQSAVNYIADVVSTRGCLRYLRCVFVAGHTPGVVPPSELQLCRSLLFVLSGSPVDSTICEALLGALVDATLRVFVPCHVVELALDSCDPGQSARIRCGLEDMLRSRRYKSADGLLGPLRPFGSQGQDDPIVKTADRWLQHWRKFLPWRPNVDRIKCWETGKFTATQRKDLDMLFELDGPDTTSWQQSSLACIPGETLPRLGPEAQDLAMVDRVLSLLVRAESTGPSAVDLFIHFVVKSKPTSTSLSYLESVLNARSREYCDTVLATLQSLSPRGDFRSQALRIAKALKAISADDPFSDLPLPLEEIAKRALEVVVAATTEFRTRLAGGSAKLLGVAIGTLANAVNECLTIHQYLPESFLGALQQVPPMNILEAMYNALDTMPRDAGCATRLKGILETTLGYSERDDGRSTIDFDVIHAELAFWRSSPNTDKRELAKMLSNMTGLDYSVYTRCLTSLSEEDDLFIREMRVKISGASRESCLSFLSYVAERRRRGQLRDDCWVFMSVNWFADQEPAYLGSVAGTHSLQEWVEFTRNIVTMMAPFRDRMEGVGLTGEVLGWWDTLSRRRLSIEYVLRLQGAGGQFQWMYFDGQSRQRQVLSLLDKTSHGDNMLRADKLIVAHLASDGNNIDFICRTMELVDESSDKAGAVVERLLERSRGVGTAHWSSRSLGSIIRLWLQNSSMNERDKQALRHVARLTEAEIPGSTDVGVVTLLQEYGHLIDLANRVQEARAELRQRDPTRERELCAEAGIEDDLGSRSVDASVPHAIQDAVDVVGRGEYEVSFPLTLLSEYSRAARGISRSQRLLIIRITSAGFCIHFNSTDLDLHKQHSYCSPSSPSPDKGICTTRPCLLTYWVGRTVHHMLGKTETVGSIHAAVYRMLNSPPENCIVCGKSMGVKLWKPGTCSRACSIALQMAPLEVRLHNLIVDSLAMDLVISSIYASAGSQHSTALLPNCPITVSKLQDVINSLPQLTTLATAPDIGAAVRGNTSDGMAATRELFLSWVCLQFRGFLMTAPDMLRIPSMPYTQQFILMNSHPEREKLFCSRAGSSIGDTGPVFHGTAIDRLFPIMRDGLKTFSNTALMRSGAAQGSAVYTGNDQGTSMHFAGNIGQGWSNSSFRNMRLMLGCELADSANGPETGATVVQDENRLLVRYVFLIPQAYKCPPRRHVAPAMTTAFTTVRSGRS